MTLKRLHRTTDRMPYWRISFDASLDRLLTSSAAAAIELRYASPLDGHLGQCLAIYPPNGIDAVVQLRVNTGNEFPIDGTSTTDHGVHVVASWQARGSDVDLPTQALLIGVDHQGAHVITDIENQ
jgi:hypothetical protein